MIQRKQSLWLLIAALLNAGVFLFDLYKYDTSVQKPLLNQQVAVAQAQSIRVGGNFALLIIAVIMTLLPLVTIFLFRNRKQQVMLSSVSIVAVLAFIGIGLMYVQGIDKATIVAGTNSYRFGLILPVMSIVFLVMAIMGIRRDDKLVKSVDRLR